MQPSNQPMPPGQKACRFCRSAIDKRATRCPYCAGDLRIWFARHPFLTGFLSIFVILPMFAVAMGAVIAGATSTLSGNTQKSSAYSMPQPLTAYRIVIVEDVSFANVKRLAVRISIPKQTSKDEMLNMARFEVERMKDRKVNAIGFFFYFEGNDTNGIADAKVDWAPEGDWAKADSVKTGDYSKHRFSEMY